jgi:hypothetical protein
VQQQLEDWRRREEEQTLTAKRFQRDEVRHQDLSSRQAVFSSSEKKLHTTPSKRTLSSGVIVVVLELCFAVVALILLYQALDSVFFLQNPGSVRSVHLQVACKPWLFAFSPSRCEASPYAGRKQNGRAS